jgi:hypothetical protein
VSILKVLATIFLHQLAKAPMIRPRAASGRDVLPPAPPRAYRKAQNCMVLLWGGLVLQLRDATQPLPRLTWT